MAGMRKTTKKSNKNRKWVILENKSDRGSDMNFFGIQGQKKFEYLPPTSISFYAKPSNIIKEELMY